MLVGRDDDVDVDVSFGERLRRLREASRLSRAALADEELQPSCISLLEAGRRKLTPAVVATLAARLGVPPEELSGAVEPGLDEPFVLAEAALGLGRPAEAVVLLLPWIDRLTSGRMARDPRLFRAGQAYVTALESDGRLDDATSMLERFARAGDGAPGRLTRLPRTISLARCHREAGELARAIDVAEGGLRRVEGLELGDVEGYAAIVSTLAGCYAERGDLLRAQLLLEDLLARADAEGSPEDRASAYWNAAITAAQRGRPPATGCGSPSRQLRGCRLARTCGREQGSRSPSPGSCWPRRRPSRPGRGRCCAPRCRDCASTAAP